MVSAPALRDRLLALAANDEQRRAELVADGTLYQGYHPGMREVHEANAAALGDIIAAHGWPGFRLAGREGAAAAWRIAQHAIALPPFQRRCLALLQAAAAAGDADPRHAATLEDRIAFNERRPQRYGTIFDWDENGEMSPWRLDDAARVEARRAALGLPPLADHMRKVRAEVAEEGGAPPADFAARQREIEAWARACGWLA